MGELSKELTQEIMKALKEGYTPIEAIKYPRGDIASNISFVKGEGKGPSLPVIKEKRCVLLVDIVKYSIRTIEEQLLLVGTLNMLIDITERGLFILPPIAGTNWKKWEIYKGTGDGAIFVFGDLQNPGSVKDAMQFAVWLLKNVKKYNNSLQEGALNKFDIRMSLAYGDIYLTEDYDGRNDVLGDSINIASRLVSVKEVKENTVLIEHEIFHNLQLNNKIYFLNVDNTKPTSGELSDYVIGKTPDGNNFLYIIREGIFETKDRTIEVFSISGRIEGIDI